MSNSPYKRQMTPNLFTHQELILLRTVNYSAGG